tara:strand:- start:271 stop:735 length:465 start_codon:yes stop_codon:yes gene_type:complete
MNKPEIDSAVSAMCAYTKVSGTCRRLLKRQLCANPCIDKVVHSLLSTDDSRRDYETLFSVVPPRDLSTVIADTPDPAKLKNAVVYHVHGIDILKEVKDSQVDYIVKLFYRLASVVHPFHAGEVATETETLEGFEKVKPKFVARSPPPRRPQTRK